MFDNLVKYFKNAKEAFDTVVTGHKPAAPVDPVAAAAGPTQSEAKAEDKASFPIVAVIALVAAIAVAIYVELHLLAMAAGLFLVLILLSYLLIQKAADFVDLVVPGSPEPGPTS